MVPIYNISDFQGPSTAGCANVLKFRVIATYASVYKHVALKFPASCRCGIWLSKICFLLDDWSCATGDQSPARGMELQQRGMGLLHWTFPPANHAFLLLHETDGWLQGRLAPASIMPIARPGFQLPITLPNFNCLG
ncbi:unnamed protein product [Lepidochelys olivacea]